MIDEIIDVIFESAVEATGSVVVTAVTDVAVSKGVDAVIDIAATTATGTSSNFLSRQAVHLVGDVLENVLANAPNGPLVEKNKDKYELQPQTDLGFYFLVTILSSIFILLLFNFVF